MKLTPSSTFAFLQFKKYYQEHIFTERNQKEGCEVQKPRVPISSPVPENPLYIDRIHLALGC